MRCRRYRPEGDREALAELVRIRRETTNHSPLSEQARVGLEREDEQAISYVAEANEQIEGFGRASATPGGVWSVELVGRDETGVEAVLVSLLDELARRNVSRLTVWSPQGAHDPVLERRGFTKRRRLLQLRRSLPMRRSPVWPPGVSVTTFLERSDVNRLVEINSLSFEDHPERSSWSEGDFNRLRRRDWWNPSGLRLALSGGDIVGFCWTKVHRRRQLGEIYVLAVDPQERRRGIGEALTIEGLRHLSEDEGMETAMLYVDGDNSTARRLYERLAFTQHHIDSVWTSQSA